MGGPRDPDRRRRAAKGGGPLHDGLQERRPLDAVHDVHIEDVDGRVALHRFEDGLVSRQMSESNKWGNLI